MKIAKYIERVVWIAGALCFGVCKLACAALLMPIGVDDVYVYNKTDSATPQNSWTFYLQGLENVDVGGQQFIRVGSFNEDGAGGYQELIVRSTDTAVYGEDGSIGFQIAPVGTAWSYASYKDELGSGVIYNEIVSIEPVTVPYGSFDTAYVQRVYFDPDNPVFANTPFWYEYLVPDVGWVKQVDNWSAVAPVTLELTHITAVPVPAAIWLLSSAFMVMVPLARNRRRR